VALVVDFLAAVIRFMWYYAILVLNNQPVPLAGSTRGSRLALWALLLLETGDGRLAGPNGRFMKAQTASNNWPWKRKCKLQWKRINENANFAATATFCRRRLQGQCGREL